MTKLTPETRHILLTVARHMDRKASWWWLTRLGHWALVSWRCPCCKEQRRRRLRKIRR